MKSSEGAVPADEGKLVLRLYIASAAPNSVRAVENLRAMCAEHFPDLYSLEIVDVLKEPLRALSDDIVVTPTLIKLAPGPRTCVIGDLSDRTKVLSALANEGAWHGAAQADGPSSY